MGKNRAQPASRPEDILIEALLQAAGTRTEAVYAFDDYRLDVANQQLLRKSVPVRLAPKEFRMLQLLVERHGRLVARQEFLDIVWKDTFIADDTIAQRISCLRKALADGTPSQYIQTVPKCGYRFIGTVRIE